ncbi:MAG: hypothetical protein BZY79_05115 [SAR202 cluster bacterium Casp-Chloro-G4]|nr:DUF1501 domain-containing protein [Chloroflexota bacterium]MDA1227328.1 DUF1501 domain-containing protein [Chloroflexota bacterium]PKB61136.1 MAG: hypothetical protein BZY79_05115 [SAR202 cluster bacterium Casp-Chloro-G4]
MTTVDKKDPVLVVVQLSGGNDYLNTVIPYGNDLYYDYRPSVGIPQDKVLHIDNEMGLHPNLAPIRGMYQGGNVAIIHGVGYENSPRSHFRSMDIWHTCEPDDVGTEGWLGRVIRELDPHKENVVTGVSFGPSMFRAMAVPGVPIAVVENLEDYGLLPGISMADQRQRILDRFSRLYGPAIGRGPVMEFLGQTGLDALRGADILKIAPKNYSSTVEYADTTLAKKLKGIAQVHLAGLGTRVFYCDHGSYDSHAGQPSMLSVLFDDLSASIRDFFDDLREHDAADNVIMLLFSEFGRRTHDNGSGTDHGAAGVAFLIGDRIKGGQYSVMPSLKSQDLQQGDPVPNLDFRSLYTTILENWMLIDANPIVGRAFEKLDLVGA